MTAPRPVSGPVPGLGSGPGIAPGRLPAETLAANFADIHPRLTPHEASLAADRCYFCHDAPCITACPTEIDIPLFIRQIATGNAKGAGRTVFEQNILGGICARVCPTETLCEEACVRMAEGDPVEIGRLQRFATDALMAEPGHPFRRADATGKRVAVVGAGPAGLACAHRLALHGHEVAVFEAREKPGGLNEYGIAAYKTPEGFAGAEVDWLLGVGGITLSRGRRGIDLSLDRLAADFDAVFLGIGLAGVNALGAAGEDLPGVRDAVDWIAELRQAADLSTVPVGRSVVVIGGGMTATDAAIQSAKLGAEVTLAYRRGRDRMNASGVEIDRAAAAGVALRTHARPLRVLSEGAAQAVEFERMTDAPDGPRPTGETFTVPADLVLKAIGQRLDGAPEGIAVQAGRILTDAEGRTSRPGVWAGGDCTGRGVDLTVTAVAQGRDAAESIHRALSP